MVLFATKPLWKKENDVLDLIYETELKYNFVIDAKVYQESEIKECNTPFRETVLTEGTFYAA